MHLLTNVRNIFIMTNGRIIEIGSYDEINEILEKSINLTYLADSSTESVEVSDNAVGSSYVEETPESETESSYIQQPNSDDSVESESSVNSLSMSLSLISLGYGRQVSRLESIVRGVSQRGRVSVNLPSAKINKFSVESPHIIRGLNQSVYERNLNVGINKSEVSSMVKLKDWTKVISYGIGNCWFIFVIVLCCMFNGIHVYVYILLANWVIGDKREQQESGDIYYYSALIIASSIIMLVAYVINAQIFWTSSKSLHESMVWRLLRAPMSYFDTNSIGKILTRFTKDIQSLGKSYYLRL